MDLGDILSVGASAASGGLFGLCGSLIGGVTRHFHNKQVQQFEKEKWQHENNLLKLQMQTTALETEQEVAISSNEGSWQGLSESYKAMGPIGTTHTWVNDVRALFRPVLTVMLWILSGWFFSRVHANGLANLTGDAPELIQYMVYSAFFSASTATAWWFGDRALTPPKYKHR